MDRASAIQSRTPDPPADSARFPAGAIVATALLSASWSWWALKQGAYFPSVFNPGIMLLCASLLVLLWSAPWRARLSLSRPARLACLGMAGLAAWTLASALWSPSPDISVSDAQRVLAYLLAFALGAWLCNMLGSRMELALSPVVIAGAIVGVVTVVQLLHSTDLQRMLDTDGTLQYPLGYRNAAAAYFLIALWPALTLAADRRLDPRLRLPAALVASLAVSLGALCQSRGSFLGVAAGLIAFFIFSRYRLRALAWMLLSALPLVIMVPLASDLFQAVHETDLTAALEPMRAAGRGVVAGLGMTLVLASLILAVERRLPERQPPAWANRRTAILSGALALVVALTAFTALVGSPTGWIQARFNQFEAGEPDLSQSSSRFTFNAGSNRSDVWRVAIEATGDDPLFGDGSGGFEYRYLRDRHAATQVARDAHSVELEMLSELGLPGFALLALALGGSFFAILRARRLGPGATVLAAGALSAAAYWLVHSSVDWFWAYPAVTAPVFGLLGAACAPGMLDLGERLPQRRRRLALGICAALLAISVVPAYLSDRFLDNAYGEFRTNLSAAYDDLDKAKFLNPLGDDPLLAEGAIAKASGDRARAISAFDEAIKKRPQEWAGHFFLAQIYAKREPKQALAELTAAGKLNPLNDQIKVLRARIKR